MSEGEAPAESEKSGSSQKILIADEFSDWRQSLIDVLQEEGHRVEATEVGGELLKELSQTAETPFGLIILGSGLRGVSGIDALHHARSTVPLTLTTVKQKAPLILITDVRADTELLETLSRRGIDGFIYRDDPLETTLSKLSAHLYRHARAHARHPVKVKGQIRFEARGDEGIDATVFDLSFGGAALAVSASALKATEQLVGRAACLSVGEAGSPIEINAIVRRTWTRRSFFRAHLALGLQFVGFRGDSELRFIALMRTIEQERDALAAAAAANPWARV